MTQRTKEEMTEAFRADLMALLVKHNAYLEVEDVYRGSSYMRTDYTLTVNFNDEPWHSIELGTYLTPEAEAARSAEPSQD